MRKALGGFFICVAILALTRVIPRPASRAGMVFLVAADASGQVYTTYGNYSAAETCNALLGATPSPGRGLHLECRDLGSKLIPPRRSEEHTSELQSQSNLVCRLLLEKKNKLNSASNILASTS